MYILCLTLILIRQMSIIMVNPTLLYPTRIDNCNYVLKVVARARTETAGDCNIDYYILRNNKIEHKL